MVGATRQDVDDIVVTGMCMSWHTLRAVVRKHLDGKELHCSIGSGTAVALGAAKLAAQLEKAGDGGKEGCRGDYLHTAELSLGIEADGGVFQPLVPRGTELPAERTLLLSTKEADQSGILIRVFEGERLLCKVCHHHCLQIAIVIATALVPLGLHASTLSKWTNKSRTIACSAASYWTACLLLHPANSRSRFPPPDSV
jgi:molecular chaperone DnaK (HSP70)